MANEVQNVSSQPSGQAVHIPLPSVSADSLRNVVFYGAVIVASFFGGHHYAMSGLRDQCPTCPPGSVPGVFPQTPPVVPAAPGVPSPAIPGRRSEVRIDPVNATCKVVTGNAQCTGTVLYPQPEDDAYFFLCAAHCIKALASEGTVTARDTGRRYPCYWLARFTDPDLCVGLIRTADRLACARVADSPPTVKTAVWHSGFGRDRPGNRERGMAEPRLNQSGKQELRLSVSHGDSGSGVFREDSGELVAVVCCTDGRGHTWGGGVPSIHRVLAAAQESMESSGRFGRFLRRTFVSVSCLVRRSFVVVQNR